MLQRILPAGFIAPCLRRFMQRLERPQKHWKFSSADRRERGFWGDYMHSLRGSNPRHRDAASTLVRRACGQQVVRPAHSRRRNRGSGRESRLELPEDRRGKEERGCRGAGSACAREVSPMSEIKLPQDAARPSGGASSYASFLYRQLPHIVVLVLAISGVAYTNISHQPLVGYWEFLALAMAVVCVVTEWAKVGDRHARWQLILKQATGGQFWSQ